ncbi:uncharacterized protein LOC143030196 [Oratosquilla oratoria]|uniref:uncharacterized protein LOC143030196 n=1 Tax=Oratosquilla oratoria TaxID=337810 RepID=UPI003F76F30C
MVSAIGGGLEPPYLQIMCGGGLYFHYNLCEAAFSQKQSLTKHMTHTGLSKTPTELLNFGLNCHIQPKFDKVDMIAEMEFLLQSLLQLQMDGKITVSSDLRPQLLVETTKRRRHKYKSLLSPQLKQEVTELRINPDLVILRADKSSIYILLNKEDHLSKIDHVLSDPIVTQILCDPTGKLKIKVNKLIAANNAVMDHLHVPLITGEFSPGYIDGNVKIHKTNSPPRPITSQIPTPTYGLVSQLDIITPYTSKKYSLKLTDEFVGIQRSKQLQGIMASLDVESLFSYAPILPAVRIIPNNVYRHPKIPGNIMKNLLLACTTEALFISPTGQLYLQVEGVAMGSPLRSESQLRDTISHGSILCITFHLRTHHHNKTPFLDVLIHSQDNTYKTTVYRKKTDTGTCRTAPSTMNMTQISLCSDKNIHINLSTPWLHHD